ncbi:MAG TPA: polysaccharide deacetylase family protein [Solirubrobacteraceae bacterium]|jgi:polysaccharide deacetylase family protein (PEP-CTERM system associated)
MPLTITFDLEDNRASPTQEPRFVAMSHRFLEFVEERGITATVFIVGQVAESHPELVRRVAEGGHEVALHGLRHVALGDVGEAQLSEELRKGRGLLEDAAQVTVEGFRAPIFSLTPSTRWAVEQLLQAGFSYSSSVLPATSPLHGWPGAPQVPFRWQNGLLEMPCPIGGIGKARLPFLGGVYLRYVPTPIARRFLRRLPHDAVAWSYSHPYDIDPDEPFFVLPYAGWLTSRILHARRGATLARLDGVIAAAGGPGRTLAEVARELSPLDLPSMPSS